VAVIILLFYNKRFFIGPVYLVFFGSFFLLRKWKDVKKEYTSPVPKKGVFLVFGIILLFVISAFSGFTKESNQTFLNHPWVSNAVLVALFFLVLVGYVILLRRKVIKKKS
jgi:cytochrome bd-type quinol oxidase subunit 2